MKKKQLKKDGVLNSNPESVLESLFKTHEFFDPNDLVQVKYEMIRKVEKEKSSISEASKKFGFSRPTFYEAKLSFERAGMKGLIPKQTGPKGGHKMSDKIVDKILKMVEDSGPYKSEELVRIIKKNFKIDVHMRTIERAIERKKKEKNQ
jgi:transposase